MPVADSVLSALGPFLDRGLIQEVLYVVKSGKEATVYCCQAGPAVGTRLVAAKVYRSREHRNFKNSSVYREGRIIRNQRDRRAVAKKSDWGREVESGAWQYNEYGTLCQLHRAGADVPAPVDCATGALLMEYLGDAEQAAPPLRSLAFRAAEAPRLFRRLIENIELFLSCDLVHGDLSPYNVLYWQGRVRVIDFPQAINARHNRNAADLLYRDIDNLSRYFEMFGVRADSERLTRSLWGRYQRGEMPT